MQWTSLVVLTLGVVSVLCGLGLLSFGGKGLRRRYRQIRHAYRQPEYDADDEDAMYQRQGYGYR